MTTTLTRKFEELHSIRPNGSLSPHSNDEVDRFQASSGVTIPSAYRRFLTEVGGNLLFDAEVRYRPLTSSRWTGEDGTQSVEVFYGLLDDQWNLGSVMETYRGRIHSSLLPIAEGPGGNQICLGLSGDVEGQLHFWDHEGERADGQPHWGNVSLIAHSFDDFVEGLSVVDEVEDTSAEDDEVVDFWLDDDL